MNYNIVYENNMNYEIDIENSGLSIAMIGDEIFSSIIEYTHCVGETVIYFLINNEKLEIRYHVFRENEEFWIHDFNKIEYPFLCMKG